MRGIAQLNDEIFVADYERCSIRVFDGWSPFIEDREIELESQPWELASCNVTMQLFVSFFDDIWRVHVEANDELEKFVEPDGDVESMSLTHCRLLVTPVRARDAVYSLSVYDVVSGDLLQLVKLPAFIKYPKHAIESNNTFIVGHSGTCHPYCYETSEVTSLGVVIRSSHEGFGFLQYLAFDSGDRVLVAHSCRDQVVLLSRDLKRSRVLLNYKHPGMTPQKLKYNECNSMLIVSLYYVDDKKYHDDVYIYHWK